MNGKPAFHLPLGVVQLGGKLERAPEDFENRTAPWLGDCFGGVYIDPHTPLLATPAPPY